jgi:hypothetical protein
MTLGSLNISKHLKPIILNNTSYIWKSIWHPQGKLKKNPPLLSITLINRFEGSCGTLGEAKENFDCCQ